MRPGRRGTECRAPALHATPRPGVAGSGHRARPRRLLPVSTKNGWGAFRRGASVAAPSARRTGPGERAPCPVALRRIPTGDVASGLPLAPRIRDAPMGSPPGTAPLTPPGARERLHWAAPRGRRHSAVSRATGSRYRPRKGSTVRLRAVVRSQSRTAHPRSGIVTT